MTTFLEIVGILALGVVLVIVALYVYIRIKLGKYAKVDTSKDNTPLTIHLNEEIEAEWISKPDAIKIEDELKSLGFSAGKTYNVVEMDGMQLRSFFNPPYTAVLYTHPIVGLWVDMVANLENGIDYTVTNAPMGGEIEHAPTEKKYWLKGASVSELFDKIQEETKGKTIKAISSDTFREYFEEAYKKEMKWKTQNGGIGLEEVRRVALNDNKKYTEEEILETFRETKRKELMKWHNVALQEYQKNENLKENECYDAFDYLFIVPSKGDTVGFIRYLADVYYLDDKQAKKFEDRYKTSDIDIKTAFKEINESFSSELRAIKKAEVNYPIDIEIYEIPKDTY